MKFATVSKTLVLGLALMLASSAFASEKGKLEIFNPVNVNGTTLKAGEYKLEWTGNGNVELNILKGKSVVAKVPARVVDLTSPSSADAAVIDNGSNGTQTLTGVRFGGKKYAIELGDASDSLQTGSSK